jgi:hypothetical protein
MRLGTALFKQWLGVALSRPKTRCWLAPATTSGTGNIGSVYACRARCAVGRLITTGQGLSAVGRILGVWLSVTSLADITLTVWAGRWRRLTRCRILSLSVKNAVIDLVRGWVSRCSVLTPK